METNPNPYIIDIALGIFTAGFIAVIQGIRPLLPEFWGLCMIPIGDAMQWLACRVQEAARRLWEAGRRLEQQGKIYRRVS